MALSFFLGGVTYAIPSEGDMNNAKHKGVFCYHLGGTNIKNSPFSSGNVYGTMITAVNNYYGMQIFVSATSLDFLYLRTYGVTRDEWSLWKKIALTGI